MSLDEQKDSLPPADAAAVGAHSGYAEHQHWCEHVASNVNMIDLRSNQFNPSSTVCSSCPNSSENWLCLACHETHCGRFASAHMLKHFEATGHCVAAGLDDLSFWCYKCESYLYHRTIPKLYSAYAILALLKFNEPPIDGPLPSAEPKAALDDGKDHHDDDGEADADEEAKTDAEDAYDSDGDTVMETSAMVRDVPTRASSQLEPFEPAAGLSSREGSQFSRFESDASQISHAAPVAAASSSSPSTSCPIVGLTPLQLAHPLIQKLCGIIYGNALGDAFGLSTEFASSSDVKRMYGPTYEPTSGVGAIPFPDYKKTRHSARWDDGDWTDDTDQMILIMETILESYSGSSRLSPSPAILSGGLFASKLNYWVHHGFPALGDRCGMGLGALTDQVVTHSDFLRHPHRAAADVWARGGKKAAANGGIMRTSITGVFDYYNDASVVANTINMCTVTHADPRCVASCVLAATLLSRCLRGAPIDTPESVESLIADSTHRALAAVDIAEHRSIFMEYVNMKSLAEMRLDDPPAIGFTLKCMASGLYGLRSRDGFIPTLTRLVREAGDADTNGAVCGAMVGARVGYDGLPGSWLSALPNKEWLDAKVVALIRLMMDRFEATKTEAVTKEERE